MIIRPIIAKQELRYHEAGSNVVSIANVNLYPHSYLTTDELKNRAQSLAHSQYKMEKRAYAKHRAKKQVLQMMVVVKCKLFINKLKKKWAQTKLLKQLEE